MCYDETGSVQINFFFPVIWQSKVMCNENPNLCILTQLFSCWIKFRVIRICMEFLSFINTEMVQIIKILFHGRQWSTHPTKPISSLLMTWWHKEPGHQQPCYWPNSLSVFLFQHQTCWVYDKWYLLEYDPEMDNICLTQPYELLWCSIPLKNHGITPSILPPNLTSLVPDSLRSSNYRIATLRRHQAAPPSQWV